MTRFAAFVISMFFSYLGPRATTSAESPDGTAQTKSNSEAQFLPSGTLTGNGRRAKT
jgi:hypothetical protein